MMIKFRTTRLMHAFRFLLTGILFVSILSGCASQKNAGSTKPFFFIQLSDPQLGFYPDSIQKEIALYERGVAEVNRLKPDFVVITGDLVNKPRDQHQLAEFKRITAMINAKIPVYYTPGNHDVGNTPAKADVDFYNAIYGYDKFSFNHKNSRFIGINSNLIKANTPVLEQEQYIWLEKELAANKQADHIIIFCHHSFFISKPDEPVEYFNIDMATRNKYLELFKKYGVTAVFAGHYHRNGYGKYGDMEMVTTSAIGEPLGKDPSGFRIITVGKDKIAHQYYSLDSIPQRVDVGR
ncbi:metallophosphoesterase [Chitinophaga sp. MM2321]|uniref:metallophosphoesterase n=1 Tax=Chitinophaga sp. MM2321 TaxID=3137178 RepID=UPI0032D5706D